MERMGESNFLLHSMAVLCNRFVETSDRGKT